MRSRNVRYGGHRAVTLDTTLCATESEEKFVTIGTVGAGVALVTLDTFCAAGGGATFVTPDTAGAGGGVSLVTLNAAIGATGGGTILVSLNATGAEGRVTLVTLGAAGTGTGRQSQVSA